MPVEDFDIAASWAAKPFFYTAPFPDSIDPTIWPRSYQHAGAEFCIARDHALIGDAPGLGKTLQSILVSNAIGAKKTLVVCPASLRLNWQREIWRYSTIPNVATYPILKASDGVSSQCHYVIVSWALLANKHILAALMAERWDHVILDEAHAMKDPKGNTRTKAVVGWMDKGTYVPGLADVAGRITALSGTILPNQPIECYNIIRLLDHKAIDFASLDDFREHYYDFGEGFITVPKFVDGRLTVERKWSSKVRNVPRHMDDLQFRLRKHVMVRRLKEQVLTELPPCAWHPFPLVVDAAIRAALKHPGWDEAARLYDMNPDAFDGGIPIDGAISTARRLLGEAKAPAVAAYIEDLIDSGVRKVVVGAMHRSVLDILRKLLDKWGLTYMDGGSSTTAKQRAVDAFQTNDDVRVILGQTQVIGEGFTLTAAQDAVLAEPDYVPGRNTQFLDRINRMGQKGAYLLGHVPVVAGTLDERVISTAIRKDQSIHAALDKR